jgi:hypothetical protein
MIALIKESYFLTEYYKNKTKDPVTIVGYILI